MSTIKIILERKCTIEINILMKLIADQTVYKKRICEIETQQ